MSVIKYFFLCPGMFISSSNLRSWEVGGFWGHIFASASLKHKCDFLYLGFLDQKKDYCNRMAN